MELTDLPGGAWPLSTLTFYSGGTFGVLGGTFGVLAKKTVLIIRYLVPDKISTIRTTMGFKKMGPKLPSLGAKNWLA